MGEEQTLCVGCSAHAVDDEPFVCAQQRCDCSKHDGNRVVGKGQLHIVLADG